MRITGFIRHNYFKKQFRKLSKETQDAFEIRIKFFLVNPTDNILNNHPLQGDRKGYWSINITGNIRAVYKIQGTIAILTEIGTHSELYDK
jgi:addiction module RelE/StbE family toxin